MKYLFGFTFSILLINICKGQHDYTPLVKENNFCINFTFFNSEPYPKPSGATLSYFQGDSIFNGKVYGKKYISSLSGSHPCPPEQRPCFVVNEPYKPIDKIFDGLYRDDTVEKKVFYIPKGNLDEVDLYNFSLSKGDTISYLLRRKMPEEYDGEGIIDSISFDNVYRKVRKVLYFQSKSLYFPFNTFSIEVIEGIGLKCDFCEGTLEQCNIISNTNDARNMQADKIEIYPNPASDYIKLQTSKTLSNVEIIDQNGKVVLNDRALEINVGSLHAGMYFVKCLSNENASYFGKFIKL